MTPDVWTCSPQDDLASAGRVMTQIGCGVRRVMRTDVHGCRPGDTVQTSLQLMARYRVRRLPVLDPQGRAVGILSLDDVALNARAMAAKDFDGPFFFDVARALQAICEPALPAQRRSH
ncbi:MAG TPA: CBS domain-containing protein [Thermoanaerobaculia bacterium]|nr:CBS domain-containing protein [Thermoanaerobaculia bacterium]